MVSDRSFSITVPKYDNSGKKIPNRYFQKYVEKMSGHFGGVTVFPTVQGHWIGEGRSFVDKNYVLSASRDYDLISNQSEALKKDKKFIKELAKVVGVELGQASIFVETDLLDDVSFIRGRFREKLGKVS